MVFARVRPEEGLLVVVAVVEVEVVVVDAAEGGRGGRRTVADVRAVAEDLARACAVLRSFEAVVEVEVEGRPEAVIGREDGGTGLAGPDIEFDDGLVVAVLAPFLTGCVAGGSGLRLGGLRTATVFDLPNTPDKGLPEVAVVVEMADGLVEAEGGFIIGKRLGDAGGGATSFCCESPRSPRGAAGFLRDRDRLNGVEDDMLRCVLPRASRFWCRNLSLFSYSMLTATVRDAWNSIQRLAPLRNNLYSNLYIEWR